MQIKLKVIARARAEKVEALPDGSYKAWVRAVPAKGRANDRLVELLSAHFRTRPANITIIKGIASRNKTVDIR